MNDATIKLIEELALKFGTTVEHLWAVLTKQAFVSSCTTLLTLTLLAVFTIVIWLFLVKYLRKEGVRASLDENDMGEPVAMAVFIFAAFSVGLIIACFFSVGSIITGFINPEYWALKQLMP